MQSIKCIVQRTKCCLSGALKRYSKSGNSLYFSYCHQTKGLIQLIPLLTKNTPDSHCCPRSPVLSLPSAWAYSESHTSISVVLQMVGLFSLKIVQQKHKFLLEIKYILPIFGLPENRSQAEGEHSIQTWESNPLADSNSADHYPTMPPYNSSS